ncbi:MAG: hypothetical protein JNK78_03995 [Planctomycetes bacterium]|nr:hypothetical protein [Planctomycetota bacterium]
MPVLVSLVLAPLTFVLPQGGAPATGQDPNSGGKAPLLAPAEQEALRTKLVKYIDATEAFDAATGVKPREKTGRIRDKARDEFDKEWAKFEKKGNLVASMADMRAIFDNCFVVPAPPFSTGQLRTEKAKDDGTEYAIFLPKTYKADKAHRTVIVMPGTVAADGTGPWTKPADYFGAVWDKTNLVTSSIVHLCAFPAELELDTMPDFSREGDEAEEERRNRAVFSGMRELTMNFNVDRNAVFLDCGRGSSGFGLRFLSMFPDRFAGIVLRHPVAVDDLRIGSLFGKPVLILKTGANGAVVDALKQRLDTASPGTTTVIDASDEYPHKASAGAIEEWMGKQRRTMSPPKVVIEPNHDRFKRAYWVSIDVADSLLGVPVDSRARIEVEAERSTNRIVVKSRGVQSFVLFLNDDLVDLDKEFTIVINDKAVVEKRVRSFRDMRDRMIGRRDWDFLFPVEFKSTVPKPAAENGEKK